jgi:hypothetical protein
MTRDRHRTLPLLWLLLLAAVVLRAGVPAGWMPTSTPQGIEVKMCSGSGPIVLGGTEGLPDHGDSDAPRDPCPFGIALSGGFDLPPAPMLDLAAPETSALTGPARVAALIAARKATLPPARGPPSFA